MKPRIKLAESTSPTGGLLELVEHDGSYSISLDGKELMHSRATASETMLGTLGVARLGREQKGRVLIGGLGLGFTLRSSLESVSSETKVDVVEMIPEVIEWNRTHLQHLNGSCLDDPRVKIHTADVTRFIRKAEHGTYDAILLDVDNGPVAMVSEGNASLYSRAGIRSICRALKQDGRIVFWSAGADEQFEKRLGRVGLQVEAVPVRSHETARCASYRLYVAGFAGNTS